MNASADWINAAERQYPVVIDPSIVVSSGTANGDISSTYVIQGSPNSAQTAYSTLYVGYSSLSNTKQSEIYLHVNSLPSLPKNCVLIGSKLAYFCPYSNGNGYTYTASSVSSLNLEIHELTPSTTPSNYKSWIQNLTWNTTHPNNSVIYDSTVIDYAKVSDDSENSYVLWDITPSVQKWYADSSSNKGLATVPESNNYSSTKAAVAVLYGYSIMVS